MSRALEEVYESAMQLSADEQVELAERLLPYEDDYSPEAIERRLEDVRSGRDELLDLETVEEMLRDPSKRPQN
jgi:hypothetical protein